VNDSCTIVRGREMQSQSAQRTPSMCAGREWPQYSHGWFIVFSTCKNSD